MNSYAERMQENKNQQAAKDFSQNQTIRKPLFAYMTNRPLSMVQRRIQEIAQNSPQINRLNVFQEIADKSPRVNHLKAIQQIVNNSSKAKQAISLKAMADNYIEKKHQIIQKKESGTGLPDNLKTGIENLSDYSMDDVNVHYNSNKPAVLNAHAYTQGSDIHLASGQEKHLPHEAWHVVQQKQGRVTPTIQMQGNIGINDDARLEQEADLMGNKAFSFTQSWSVSRKPQEDSGSKAGMPLVFQGKIDHSLRLQKTGHLPDAPIIQRMLVKFTDVDRFEIVIPPGATREKKIEALTFGIYNLKVNPTEDSVITCLNYLSTFAEDATVSIKYMDYFRWQGRWGNIKYAFTGPPEQEVRQPEVRAIEPVRVEAPAIAIPMVAHYQPREDEKALSPFLSVLFAPRFAKPGKPNALRGIVIAETITPLVSRFVSSVKYDRLVFAEQFLAHFKKVNSVKKTSAKDAFLDFVPSSSVALTRGGAHCAGQAGAMVEQITKLGISCYLVPSVLQGTMAVRGGPPFGHAAVVIPFLTESEKGVILVDPGFNLAIPFVLKVGDEIEHIAGPYTWKLCYRKDGEIQAKSGQSVAGYDTNVALANPDEAITKPLTAVDTRLSISKRDEKGVSVASIVIDLITKKVDIKSGELKMSVDFAAVPTYISRNELISRALAQLLDSTQEELNNRILGVITDEKILAELRTEAYEAKGI